jgi:hypothetical protein
VNVIDASSASAPFLKTRSPVPHLSEGAFASVYRLAFYQQDQMSLGGKPLRLFTRAFQSDAVVCCEYIACQWPAR